MAAVTRTMILDMAICLSEEKDQNDSSDKNNETALCLSEEEEDDNKDKDYDARDGSFPV